MKQDKIHSETLGESYIKIEHPSGLTMLLYPMEGFSVAHALFATRYGSIDDCFKTGADKEFLEVPAGIAHFLEHKLFENEQGDVFSLYAATGASANAFTSFEKTAYLFSCTDHFEESLEILLNFVTHPYFSQKTVEKEQGIIGQEIRMYDDSPDWQVFFGLLGALYQNHPISIDIAGTVETIAKIDADLLYRCYGTFYNLHNMVLSIAGNFTVETVIQVADRILKPAEPIAISRREIKEPPYVQSKRVEKKLAVAQPLFQIGFKAAAGDYKQNIADQIRCELILELIAGESTPLYRKLYDQGLINQVFVTEVLAGPNYIVPMLSGEGRDPDEVYRQICGEIESMKEKGLEEDRFLRAQRACYGRYMGIYSNPESVAGLLLLAHMSGMEGYEILDILTSATSAQLYEMLPTHFNSEYSALSVITPAVEGDVD